MGDHQDVEPHENDPRLGAPDESLVNSPGAVCAKDHPVDELADGPVAARILLAVSVFFLLFGAWSWTNRVEVESSPVREMMRSGDLAELRLVDLGVTLPMTATADSNDQWILDYGFHTPEPDGTWIVDFESRIIFEARSGSPETLELRFYPFLHGDVTERELEVRTSSETVTFTVVDGINSVTVSLDGEPSQVIDIGCSRLDSPKDLGMGADKRPLCAKLLSVRVD